MPIVIENQKAFFFEIAVSVAVFCTWIWVDLSVLWWYAIKKYSVSNAFSLAYLESYVPVKKKAFDI
jgi:hypothetical protein